MDINNIVIIGTEPAALITALALQKQSIKYTIIEQQSYYDICNNNDIYYLNKNSLIILESLGLQKAIQICKKNVINGFDFALKKGVLIRSIDYPSDSYIYSIKQSDLQKILLKKINKQSLYTNSDIQSIQTDINIQTILLKNGNIIKTKVLIGADGIHSIVGKTIFPKKTYNIQNQHSINYSGIFHINPKHYYQIYHSLKPGRILLFKVQGIIVRIGIQQNGIAYWNIIKLCNNPKYNHLYYTNNPQKLKILLQNLITNEIQCNIVNLFINETKPYNIKTRIIYDKKPLKTWSKYTCILIGNAAHPNIPFIEQGLNSNIIDGMLIGTTLGNLINKQSFTKQYIYQIFELFYKIRYPSIYNTRKTKKLIFSESSFSNFLYESLLLFIPQWIYHFQLLSYDKLNKQSLLAIGLNIE